ncbi:hypothetical protein [Shinella zoogloeoides]|uniref:Uncharacterized protein n=1 Tax=Shinella zoogloeoides TaxID=352475 RepID=A0A6N8TA17_SHIZO|nr:hypothetical protein [Shinella zoogloeoides]MXN99420.1 hypothetical protein [Shinella zoogloeoides]UEX82801.1 hypothetical protein K8M09_05845 [Shinella zoogloeoides]
MADQWKPFTCTYRLNGRGIGLTVYAFSMDEVSARLRAIGMTARINVGPHPKSGQFRSYACCYEFQGRWSEFRLDATSRDDAAARFRAIGMTGVVEGEQVREIDAGIVGEGLGRALIAAKAMLGGRGQ